MKAEQLDQELERLAQQVGRLVSKHYTPARLRRGGESLVEVHAMALEELSTYFTSAREELPPGYLDRPQARAAYLLYYLPVGVATALAALRLSGLEELLEKVPPRIDGQTEDAPLRVLDLAAGPMTASLAVAIAFPNRALEVVALDRSARALQDGQALMAGLRPNASVRVERRDLRDRELLRGLGGARFDLVIVGHAINELRPPAKDRRRKGGGSEDTAALLCDQLLDKAVADGGHLLIYEPATRAASQRLIAVREALLAAGDTRIVAPCMGAMACPLAADDSRSWCHTEQPWRRPSLVEACDRAIGHRRTSLKLSYLALTRDRVAAAEETAPRKGMSQGDPVRRPYRVIGGQMNARGRLRRYLCGQEGRVVAEARESDVNERHWLRQAWRGDRLSLEGAPDAGKDRRGGDPVLEVKVERSASAPRPDSRAPSRSEAPSRPGKRPASSPGGPKRPPGRDKKRRRPR